MGGQCENNGGSVFRSSLGVGLKVHCLSPFHGAVSCILYIYFLERARFHFLFVNVCFF